MIERPRAAPPVAVDFRALFEAHVAYVWRSLRRFGVRPADVPDQAHEVFVTLFRRIEAGTYDDALPPRPFLGAIAFRVASDYRRLASVKREVIGEDDEASPTSAPGADDLLVGAQDRALVLAALLQIPEERRGVLVMHDIDEIPVPEIARAMEIPLNTAYSRLRLARQDFRRAVLRLSEEGGGL